jgi:hypothetical protein
MEKLAESLSLAGFPVNPDQAASIARTVFKWSHDNLNSSAFVKAEPLTNNSSNIFNPAASPFPPVAASSTISFHSSAPSPFPSSFLPIKKEERLSERAVAVDRKRFLFFPELPFNFKINDIEARRNYIMTSVGGKYGYYPKLSQELLQSIFELIDHYFFGKIIATLFNEFSAKLKFDIQQSLTSSAGNMGTMAVRKEYLMKISFPIFTNINEKNVSKLKNGGMPVKNMLHALVLTLEHELVHLLIPLMDPMNSEIHGNLFTTMMLNIFGHTDIYHNLKYDNLFHAAPSELDNMTERLRKTAITVPRSINEFYVSQRVSYMHTYSKNDKRRVNATIKKINIKRVIVVAEIGNELKEFSVPFSMLSPIAE